MVCNADTGDMRIRAIVFDFDGLILDTETPLVRAWSEAYARYGCTPLTITDWGRMVGTVNGLDPLAIMLERLDPAGPAVDPVEAERLVKSRVRALIALETTRPGVTAWLDDADRLGLRIGLASSSSAAWVEGHLERLALRSRFEALACYRPGVAPKPDPYLYRQACETLGIEPAQALAVEDAPFGIAAAKAAGLRCVAVPNGLTGQLDLARADLVVPSLADVSLPGALARLGAQPG